MMILNNLNYLVFSCTEGCILQVVNTLSCDMGQFVIYEQDAKQGN